MLVVNVIDSRQKTTCRSQRMVCKCEEGVHLPKGSLIVARHLATGCSRITAISTLKSGLAWIHRRLLVHAAFLLLGGGITDARVWVLWPALSLVLFVVVKRHVASCSLYDRM